MKVNLPVSHIEFQLPEGEFIYSSTDLKGVIIEANEAFSVLSHFPREEMIGQSHNMVRHPDMPVEAFEDMWRDLKVGRPWRGIVKNRRKDGGFYWVIANVSAVLENGRIVGYQSVRGRPSREDIAAAEGAYKRIKDGDKTIFVEHGRIVKRRPAWLNTLLSLRIQMIVAGVTALFPGFATLSHHLGGPALPDFLAVSLASVTILYALYFLFIYIPLTTRDLDLASGWLEDVLCSGDLKKRLHTNRRDVIGDIARKADIFVSSVQATIQGISDMARQVNLATDEVNSGMKVSQQSALRQSEATASAAAAIEEVTTSIGEVASHAQTTVGTATHTGEISRQGAQVTHDAAAAIELLAGAVHQSAEQVASLGVRSEEIRRVTGVIKEIADQTNLLALNAAIEAARAGEQGRGFAVVADEVRKLAERTARATQEIGDMSLSIQTEIHHAVDCMHAGEKQAVEGVSRVNDAEESLRQINLEMGKTTGMVGEISHASNEQQAAMIALAQDLERVSKMTGQNLTVINQTGATVEYLNSVVTRMRKAVTQYSV
jgi:aerotaxis receptor